MKKLQQENEQLQRTLDSVVQELHLWHGLYEKLGAPVPESLTRFLTELQAQPVGSVQAGPASSAAASLPPAAAAAAWAASVAANGGASSAHHLMPSGAAAGAPASDSAAMGAGGMIHAAGGNSLGSESDSPSQSSDSPQSAGGLYQQPITSAAGAALGVIRSAALVPLEALGVNRHPPRA